MVIIYELIILLILIFIYAMSILKFYTTRKGSTFKENYQKLTIVGLAGGMVFGYFRTICPFFTRVLILDVITEFFMFIHMFVFVSYFFVGKD